MIADRQTHRQTDTLVALLRAALSEKQSNGTTFEILWLHIARSAADEDHQRAVVAAIQTGNDVQKDPTTRG